MHSSQTIFGINLSTLIIWVARNAETVSEHTVDNKHWVSHLGFVSSGGEVGWFLVIGIVDSKASEVGVWCRVEVQSKAVVRVASKVAVSSAVVSKLDLFWF